MSEKKSTLLIVEDDLDIAEMLKSYFSVQGYEVLTENWGEDGVATCLEKPVDLVVLDIRLPDIDGFEVALRLRNDRRTRDLPIIFLTERRERVDRLKGLSLQADDYITKPFDIQELRLRVRNSLLRAHQGTLTNPVTGLPDGSLVDEALERWMGQPNQAAMVILIKNFEFFREAYGFVAADDLLRASALMIRDAASEIGSKDDFIGHLSQTRLLILARTDLFPALEERILKRLEPSFEYFYPNQGRSTVSTAQRLSVQIRSLHPGPSSPRDAAFLRTELERICL